MTPTCCLFSHVRAVRHIDTSNIQLLTHALYIRMQPSISKIAVITPIFAVIEYNEFKRFVNMFCEALRLDANKVRIIAYRSYNLHRFLFAPILFVRLQTIDPGIIGDITTTATEYRVKQRQSELLCWHGILCITCDGTVQIEIRVALPPIGAEQHILSVFVR